MVLKLLFGSALFVFGAWLFWWNLGTTGTWRFIGFLMLSLFLIGVGYPIMSFALLDWSLARRFKKSTRADK